MSLRLDKSDWQRVSLGTVATASREKVDPSDRTVTHYVAGEHMDSNDLEIRRWGNPNETDLGPAFHRRFRPGQVLYGSRRTYLRKVAVAGFEGVCANTTFAVATKDPRRLLQEFLPFLMSAEPFHSFAIAESKGSVNPYVNWSDIERYKFGLPPIEEQRRIADLLWVVENHRRAVRREKDAAAGLVQQVRAARLDRRPWTTTVNEYIAGITAGRSLPAGTTPAQFDTLGVLKVSAVGANGFIATENKELIDQAGFVRSYSLRKGDLLITRANTSDYVGRPAIVDADYPNLMLSDKTLRLEVDQTQASAEFVLELMLAPRTRATISGMATGTGAAMKNISQAQIRALPAPAIGHDEQGEILAELRAATRIVTAAWNEIASTRQLQKTLIAEVFGNN